MLNLWLMTAATSSACSAWRSSRSTRAAMLTTMTMMSIATPVREDVHQGDARKIGQAAGRADHGRASA